MSSTSSAPRPGRAASAVVAVAAGAAAAVSGAASGAAGAPAAADGDCHGDAGVRVVLDGGPLGGGVSVRCVADGAGRPVAEVTEDAGVDITWVQRYPGAFVCRLDARPADLACADTPPGDGYWGLFVSRPGQPSWTYAAQGAGALALPAGGVVGWRFQDGGRLEPPAHRVDQRDRTAGAGGTAAATTPGATGTSGRASPAGDEQPGGGGSTVVGLALLAGLGAAGVVVARRRGREGVAAS